MYPKRFLPALIALLLASALLAACGGSDDEGTTETAATTEAEATTTAPAGEPEDEPGAGQAAEAPASGSGSSDSGAAPATRDDGQAASPAAKGNGKPASLETNPGSIRGARVTAKGAVQTLPPSQPAQEEAMENSYSSIKTFGKESEGEEATDITFALVQYLNAKASGDWATACARLYSFLRANLEKEGGGCADTYGSMLSRVAAEARAEAAQIDVASIRRGPDNRAFVIYKTPDVLSADMPMYLDGDVWTVGALEAYVLTPEQLEAGK